MPSEVTAELDGARVVWDLERMRSPESDASPWRLEGELDFAQLEALRVVSAAFEDGAMLAVAALRPAGAAGHDAETVRGILVDADGTARVLHEVLISTELGADGRSRRLGLELYESDDSLPLRVAADGEREISVRIEGTPGHGRYDVVTGP